MKHFKVFLVVAGVLLIGFILNPTQLNTTTKTVKASSINNIEVNVTNNNTDFYILPGDSTDFIVEYTYNNASVRDGLVFDYVAGDTLHFDSYSQNKMHILSPKNVITIYVPKGKELNTISTKINRGFVDISNITVDNVITSGDQVDLMLKDSVVKNVDNTINYGNTILSNTVASTVKLAQNNGTLVFEKSSSDELNVNYAKNGLVIANFSTFATLNNLGADTEYFFTINAASNHKIITDKKLSLPKEFDQIDDGYQYIGIEEDPFISVIKLGAGKINTIVIE